MTIQMIQAKQIYDPFAQIEQQIRAQFDAETAAARARMEKRLATLGVLRESMERNGDPVVPPVNLKSPETIAVSPAVSLKRAMIQAINDLKTDITRRQVMAYIRQAYPHLNDVKEGTVASTFSRVKHRHLEPANADSTVFRLKEVPADDEQE